MRFAVATVSICTLLFSSGCANPIGGKPATDYAQAASNALQSGDWATARMYLSKAIVDAQLGRPNPAQLAVLHYEHGRASGVVCEFSEAEKSLIRAYELDKQAGDPTYISLLELGRLMAEQKKFVEAAAYYERVIPELEANRASTEDPIGFADILDEYAIALRNANRAAEAQVLATRGAKIRSANAGKVSITDRTPYGQKCTPG